MAMVTHMVKMVKMVKTRTKVKLNITFRSGLTTVIQMCSRGMYVCVYVYVYVYIYIVIYVKMFTYTELLLYVCVYIWSN